MDWDLFLQQATRHGITGLVHQRLNAFESDVPPSVLAALHQARRKVIWQNMKRLRELTGLVGKLRERGIPVMPFKGPVLADCYYDDLAFRQYGDLDLLVRRDDVLRVKKLLEDRDYAPYRDLSPAEEQDFIDSQMAYEFVHSDSGVIVEVHWALIHVIHGFRLQPEAVWRRAQTVRIGNVTIQTFAPSDLIIYLAAHGSKHGWYRLLWACDMDRVVRAHHHDQDWIAIHEEAQHLGCARTLRLGLRVAHRWIGTPIPSALRGAVENDGVLTEMIDYIEEHWLFADHRPKDDPISVRAPYLSKTRERWQDRWAYYKHLIRIAVTPTEKDRAFVSLPPSLSFLYYGVRPVRVLRDWMR